MKLSKIISVFLLLSTIVLLAGPALSPDRLPDFKLKATNGEITGPSEFKDKTIIINFWATWCPPCRREIPDLIKIQKEHPEVVVLGINLDRETEKVVPFIREHGINFTVLYGNDEIIKQFGGIDFIPQTFVYNKSGQLLQKFNGIVTESDLKKLIKISSGKP